MNKCTGLNNAVLHVLVQMGEEVEKREGRPHTNNGKCFTMFDADQYGVNKY